MVALLMRRIVSSLCVKDGSIVLSEEDSEIGGGNVSSFFPLITSSAVSNMLKVLLTLFFGRETAFLFSIPIGDPSMVLCALTSGRRRGTGVSRFGELPDFLGGSGDEQLNISSRSGVPGTVIFEKILDALFFGVANNEGELDFEANDLFRGNAGRANDADFLRLPGSIH
jgi:hypothetical protein